MLRKRTVQRERLLITCHSREHVVMTTGPPWIGAITIDCDDAAAMRSFYKEALGDVDIPGFDQSIRVGGMPLNFVSLRTGCGRPVPAGRCPYRVSSRVRRLGGALRDATGLDSAPVDYRCSEAVRPAWLRTPAGVLVDIGRSCSS